LYDNGINAHVLRDVTRGGLGTVLNEIASASGAVIELSERDIPVDSEVKGFCGIMGLDPIYMGNEGKMVAFVSSEEAERALAQIRAAESGRDACIIGKVTAIAGASRPASPADSTANRPANPAGSAANHPANPAGSDASGTGHEASADLGFPHSPHSPQSPNSPGSPANDRGLVIMRTRIGGTRRVDVLFGEGLPRIC
jgi:hydrogenase maturation factor